MSDINNTISPFNFLILKTQNYVNILPDFPWKKSLKIFSGSKLFKLYKRIKVNTFSQFFYIYSFKMSVTHFIVFFVFYTPWGHQKASAFLIFAGGGGWGSGYRKGPTGIKWVKLVCIWTEFHVSGISQSLVQKNIGGFYPQYTAPLYEISIENPVAWISILRNTCEMLLRCFCGLLLVYAVDYHRLYERKN